MFVFIHYWDDIPLNQIMIDAWNLEKEIDMNNEDRISKIDIEFTYWQMNLPVKLVQHYNQWAAFHEIILQIASLITMSMNLLDKTLK